MQPNWGRMTVVAASSKWKRTAIAQVQLLVVQTFGCPLERALNVSVIEDWRIRENQENHFCLEERIRTGGRCHCFPPRSPRISTAASFAMATLLARSGMPRERERERERERRNERNGRKLFGSTFFLTVTAAAADVATCGGRANYIYICGNGELHYTR